MTRFSFLLLSVLPAWTLASTTGISYEDGSASCSGGFTLDSFDLSCDDDDGVCTLGEEVGISGQITASSALPSYANVTAEACIYSYICYTYDDLSAIDLCSFLTSSDGSSECPSAGSYTFGTSASAPGDGSWDIPSWLQGYSFTVKLTFSDSKSSATSTTCSVTVSTTASSSSDSTEYQMIAGATVALAVVAGIFVNRRRRRAARISTSSLLEMGHVPGEGATVEQPSAIV